MLQTSAVFVINWLLLTVEKAIDYIVLEADYQTDGSDVILQQIATLINTSRITGVEIPIKGVEYTWKNGKLTAGTMNIEIEGLTDLESAKDWLTEVGQSWADDNSYRITSFKEGKAYWGFKEKSTD